MSYTEDCEDIGGYLADLDFYTEECIGDCYIEECIDDCRHCDWKYECSNSDYVG